MHYLMAIAVLHGRNIFLGAKKIKIDSHRDHRAHRGKKLDALGVLGGKKCTLDTINKYRPP